MTQQENAPLHVLALSGGGYRGLYTATVLAELEQAMGRPLATHFDLICGTSVGGMLALGLAAEVPAVELKRLFEEHGRRIFSRTGWIRRAVGFWVGAKYEPNGLDAVLRERFGDMTVGQLRHRVLIPTVNCATGLGQFFKTPHHPKFELDYRMKVVDVARATTAAPAYFPLARNDRGVYADGGLVGNAPGFFGLHEVRQFLAPDSASLVRVLSIGTMSIGATVRGSASPDRGVMGWGADLFNLMLSAQESAADYMLKHSLGEDYYVIDDKVTPEQSLDIKKLDLVTPGSTLTLRDRGTHAAQRALGDAKFAAFRSHQAPPAKFFHGPNKNV